MVEMRQSPAHHREHLPIFPCHVFLFSFDDDDSCYAPRTALQEFSVSIAFSQNIQLTDESFLSSLIVLLFLVRVTTCCFEVMVLLQC